MENINGLSKDARGICERLDKLIELLDKDAGKPMPKASSLATGPKKPEAPKTEGGA